MCVFICFSSSSSSYLFIFYIVWSFVRSMFVCSLPPRRFLQFFFVCVFVACVTICTFSAMHLRHKTQGSWWKSSVVNANCLPFPKCQIIINNHKSDRYEFTKMSAQLQINGNFLTNSNVQTKSSNGRGAAAIQCEITESEYSARNLINFFLSTNLCKVHDRRLEWSGPACMPFS